MHICFLYIFYVWTAAAKWVVSEQMNALKLIALIDVAFSTATAKIHSIRMLMPSINSIILRQRKNNVFIAKRCYKRIEMCLLIDLQCVDENVHINRDPFSYIRASAFWQHQQKNKMNGNKMSTNQSVMMWNKWRDRRPIKACSKQQERNLTNVIGGRWRWWRHIPHKIAKAPISLGGNLSSIRRP